MWIAAYLVALNKVLPSDSPPGLLVDNFTNLAKECAENAVQDLRERDAKGAA